jgi:hypothetical protein
MEKHRDSAPDERLQSLASRINAQVPAGMQVNFFRREWPDGRTATGMIYQFGDRRDSRVSANELKDEHIPGIVKDMLMWAGKVQQNSRWTEDLSEADWNPAAS